MHDSAYEIGSAFLSTYGAGKRCVIVEIGALNVNGSLRDTCPPDFNYLGIDFEQGSGVDLVVRPGQPLPLSSEFADIVISSSQLEHDSEFWINLTEMFRILKTGGVVYINTPSNGEYHPYPSDVWRFYPDAGKAFAALGRKNAYPMTLLESFIAKRKADQWNDFVCVLYKGEWPEMKAVRYLSDVFESYNVWRFQAKEMLRRQTMTEDQAVIANLRSEIARLEARITKLPGRRRESRISRAFSRMKRASKRWSDAGAKEFGNGTSPSPLDPLGPTSRIDRKAL